MPRIRFCERKLSEAEVIDYQGKSVKKLQAFAEHVQKRVEQQMYQIRSLVYQMDSIILEDWNLNKLAQLLEMTTDDIDNIDQLKNISENQIILEKVMIDEINDAMVVGFSAGETPLKVSGNLTLPTPSTNGITVLWSSNDITTISNSGVVTPLADADKNVTLTAKISRSVTFVTYSIALFVPQTVVGSIYSAREALEIGYVGIDSSSSQQEMELRIQYHLV
jgi:hypothetical protein